MLNSISFGEKICYLPVNRETENFENTEQIWSATILPAQLAAVCASKNIGGISTYNNEDEKAVYEKAEKRTKHRNEIKNIGRKRTRIAIIRIKAKKKQ